MAFKRKPIQRSQINDLNSRSGKKMTLIKKVEILNKLALGEAINSVALFYHIRISTVKMLKNNESKIRTALSNSLIFTDNGESSNNSQEPLNEMKLELLNKVNINKATDTDNHSCGSKNSRNTVRSRNKAKATDISKYLTNEESVSQRKQGTSTIEMIKPLGKSVISQSIMSDSHCDDVSLSTCTAIRSPADSKVLNDSTNSRSETAISNNKFPAASIVVGIQKIMEGANVLKKLDNNSDIVLQLVRDFKAALLPYKHACKDLLQCESKSVR